MNRDEVLKECEHLRQSVECYSRVVGYFRPVGNWNIGKKQEYSERKTFDVKRLQ